jgi:hypothetical protein
MEQLAREEDPGTELGELGVDPDLEDVDRA